MPYKAMPPKKTGQIIPKPKLINNNSFNTVTIIEYAVLNNKYTE